MIIQYIRYIQMQVIYGFIYYFTLFMTAAILSLSVFIVKPMRRLLVRFWRSYTHLLEHDFFRYAFLLVFSLIGLVFLQSGYILFILEAHFSTSSDVVM